MIKKLYYWFNNKKYCIEYSENPIKMYKNYRIQN